MQTKKYIEKSDANEDLAVPVTHNAHILADIV
jgi:hypothetical protein